MTMTMLLMIMTRTLLMMIFTVLLTVMITMLYMLSYYTILAKVNGQTRKVEPGQGSAVLARQQRPKKGGSRREASGLEVA